MATDDQLDTDKLAKKYIIRMAPAYKDYEVKCMQKTTFRSIIKQINQCSDVLARPDLYNLMWCPPGNNDLVLVDLDTPVTLPSNKTDIRIYCNIKNSAEKQTIYVSVKSHADISNDDSTGGEFEDHNIYPAKVYLPTMIINQEHLIKSIASELKCDPTSIKSIYTSYFKDGVPVMLTKPYSVYALDNAVDIGDMFVQLDKAAVKTLYINTMKSQVNTIIDKFTKLLESV
jgi:hypothetical protein